MQDDAKGLLASMVLVLGATALIGSIIGAVTWALWWLLGLPGGAIAGAWLLLCGYLLWPRIQIAIHVERHRREIRDHVMAKDRAGNERF